MNIGFLITARLKSKRLPKKAMLPLNGYSVVERVIQRAKQVVKSDKVVLCTSTDHQDLPLVETAIRNKIYYFNGHLDDVLQRLLDSARLFGFDFFLGITADNPLFSIEYARRIKESIQNDPALDYVFTSKLPIGLNIYGLKVNALETVSNVKEIIDTEIWGPLINRPEIFNVKELKVDAEHIKETYRLTIDEQADYEIVKTIYEKYEEDHILNINDIYGLLDNNERLSTMNSKVIQRGLDRLMIEKIDRFYRNNQERILQVKSDIYLS